MAGIYIHIPFCKQPCSYCNFFFTTSQYFKDSFIAALLKEVELQKNYLNHEEISTIYFGGGTPSLLSSNEISTILEKIYSTFKIVSHPEITLEANPDDLTREKILQLKEANINRLSIGIQSFFDQDLKLMNRAHNSVEAETCIKFSQDVEITNISIDLIYGTPGLTEEKWIENLNKAENFNIKHLSCYALTVEENTPLYHSVRKKKTPPPNDSDASKHFEILATFAQNNHWRHYEISNLCKDGYISQHNSSYWLGKKYLGLGPSAHSYNHHSRQWNIANMKKYIETLNHNKLNYEIENLTPEQQWNEKIMIGLRTDWGLNLHELQNQHPQFYQQFLQSLTNYSPELIEISQNTIKLTKQGMLYADKIASDFFM